MKVVHLVHSYPPEFRGGTEACVQTLTAAQRARGDQPLVVAGSDQRHESGDIALEAVDHVPVCRVHRKPDENYSMDHRLPRVAQQLVELVDSEGPDVVHLHHWLNLSGDLAQRLTERGHLVVATLHDFTLVCARFFLTRPDGESCAQAFPLPSDRCLDCVLPDFPGGREQLTHELAARQRLSRGEAGALALAMVPSRVVARRWEASGLFPSHKLVVLPHAASLASADAVPARVRADGRLVLATWGHLAPAKGVQDLLAAMARLGDPRLALLVLGQPVDAGFAEELLDGAEGLDVTFGGAYTPADLRRYAAGIDLAVFPSRAEETFGLVVAEARALGLPVVGSDRGALPEGVGLAGACVPAASPDALAGLLQQILDDPARLQGWRAAARSDLLDPAAHADEVAALYERAAAGRAQPPGQARS